MLCTAVGELWIVFRKSRIIIALMKKFLVLERLFLLTVQCVCVTVCKVGIIELY